MYLTEALHRHLKADPDRVATICGDRTRTLRESTARIARLASAFVALGVRRRDRVGILALNSDRYLEYVYATVWIGAFVNPLNTRWSTAETAVALADSETVALLIDDTFAAAIPELKERCPTLKFVIHCGDEQLPDGARSYEALVADNPPVADDRIGGDEAVGIFYTGGTTGRPKGVVLSHRNVLTGTAMCLSSNDAVTPGGRSLHVAPLFHLAGLGGMLAPKLIQVWARIYGVNWANDENRKS